MTVVRGLYSTTGDTIPVSVDSAGRVQVSGSSAAVMYVSSPTAGHVHTQSLTSAGLHYCATPTSAGLTTKPRFKLTTASFTSGYRIAGAVAATSTNITAGTYRVMATGNVFYCRIAGTAATLTTPAYVIGESMCEVLYIGSTKLSTICASAAGALYLTKMS
jgi:hypothetical protein